MKEEFMEAAWASFVDWALKQPEIRAEFQAVTGLDLGYHSPPKSGLDALIDEATGYNKRPSDEKIREATEAFALWVSEHYWGLDEAPIRVREAILRKGIAGGACPKG